jgi:glutathione S-transferase
VLTALYENDTPFEPHVVDLFDAASAAALKTIWPIGKFPVLHDNATKQIVPESSIIIEYLDTEYPGRTKFVPSDPAVAREVRLRDRFYDLHVHTHMQKVVGDRLRPTGQKDVFGVEQARTLLRTALGMIDQEMATRTWAAGDSFTMADCAAAPALFYSNMVMPLRDGYPHAAAYLDRLMERPSYARALAEAKPYFDLFPK